jgi:DNA-binding Lrp family transcriptional regulator
MTKSRQQLNRFNRQLNTCIFVLISRDSIDLIPWSCSLRYDMLRDSWAGLISDTWAKIGARIADGFGLDEIETPRDMRPSFKTRQGYFGGWIQDRQLLLSNECLRGNISHIGVLAREYMREVLAKEGFEQTVLEDFSFAFGALWSPSKSQKAWYEKWGEYRQRRGDESTGLFYPHIAFHLFQSFSGSEYFNKLLTEYILMKRSGLELSESDYVLHMLERLQRFSVQFNKTDFSLIRRLLDDPAAKRSDLARETETTVSWVSRRLVFLQNYGILRKVHEVFYQGLGLKEFIFLMDSDEVESIADYIMDSPFLYSAHRIVAGDFDLVGSLLVPENPKNTKALETCLKILADNDISTSMHEVLAYNTNLCFDHYSTKWNQWELPWDLFGSHLRRIYDEKLARLMAPQMKACKKADLKLEPLDLQILNEYKRGLSLRALRREVGIKYQRLVSRIERMKNHGLLREVYELHHCGLHESLLVHIPDISYGDSITSWAQRLPQTRSIASKGGEALIYLYLPDGGLQGMAKVMQILSPSLKPMLLDSKVITGKWYSTASSWWESTMSLWDSEHQQWLCPEEEISRWFETLP